MNRRRLLAGVVVGIVATAVAAHALRPGNAIDKFATAPSLARGPRLDPIGEATFITLKDERFTLRDLRGKVVLLNFWATSCPACVREMPELVRTYRQYHGRGLEIIAVAMSSDSPTFVKEFSEKNRLPFPVALDAQKEIAQTFGGVKVVPTTFVLDKNGQLVSRTLGMIAFDKLHAYLDQTLNR